MPVPKRKRSRARRDSRFANKGVKVTSITHCAQCREPLKPHQACNACGFYKGAKVLTTKQERATKRTELAKAKAAAKAAGTPEEPIVESNQSE